MKPTSNLLKKSKANHGFTILETMVSLVLVFLALVIMSRVTASAMQAYTKARASFYLLQECETQQNKMIGKPYDSPEWQARNQEYNTHQYTIKVDIQNRTPELKFARLTLCDVIRHIQISTQFYKSQYITNKQKKFR